MITPMPWRRALILMFLAVWVFTGPIGMAFDGCALSCDEPCALSTASISVPPTVPFIASVAGTAQEPLRGRPIRTASSLEPPPRPSALSA